VQQAHPDTSDAAPERRRTVRWLAAIVLTSALVKLALLFAFVQTRSTVDEHLYVEGAQAIVEDGAPSYSNPYWDEAHASPIFPYFLAACIRVVGEEHFALVARLIQVLLSSLSLLFVWAIARRAFSERTGLLAAAAVGFYPPLVFFSQYLLSETIYIFFALAAAAALVRHRAGASPRMALCAGILGGLAALTRSVFMVHVPLVVLWLFFAGKPEKRRFLSIGLFLAGVALAVGPWSIRNTTRYGSFLLIDSNAGNVLHKNVNAIRPENYDFGLHRLRAEELRDYVGPPPLRERVDVDDLVARNNAEVRAALDYATDHPGRYLRNTAYRTGALFNPTSMLVRYVRYGRYGDLPAAVGEPLVLVVMFSCMLAMFFGVIGLMRGFANQRQGLVGLFLLASALVCVLIISDSRYRLPLMPFWIPFAVYGVGHVRTLFRPGRGRVTLALLAGLVALWVHYVPYTYSSIIKGVHDAPARGANLLVISIDSLRADHLHCYGYERETSPAIDAIAAEGIVFENTIAQAPWTLPSHTSLLTSMYPRTHQVTDKERRLPAGARTLGRMLEPLGYDNRAVVSGPFMQAQFGLRRGFREYDDSIAVGGHKRSHRVITSANINAKANRMLDEIEAPFFLFLHYWDVHYDYQPPPPYDRMFDPDYSGSLTGTDFIGGEEVHAGMSERDLEHVIALYDGEIAWVDHHVGEIVASLKKRGLYENTVIVVTSDHGDEFLEHGQVGHQHSLYEELLRVPFIMRVPGEAGGRRVQTIAQSIDIMPTLLDYLGAPPSKNAQGRSQYALLHGDEPQPLPVIAENTKSRKGKETKERTQSWCVYSGPYKYIAYADDDYPPELYDLTADPGEQADISTPANAAIMADLDEALAAWRRRTMELEPAFHKGIAKRTAEDLRMLGYAGDDEDEDEDED
jgi:arylsulfatase A-like enzyme/4-amino-4-deoxy-L-arabinose transferase-like glycosyltransferase